MPAVELALLWVLALLVFEVFFVRRAWCRYACPIGLTYGVVGIISPVRIKYKLDGCFHEGDCRKVCLVPHVLDTVIKGRAVETEAGLREMCTKIRQRLDLSTVVIHPRESAACATRDGVVISTNAAAFASLPLPIDFSS